MSNVAILTDSCAYLPQEEANELGIHIIPMRVKIGDEVLQDNSPETIERFFQAQENGKIPQVLSPTPEDFEKAYSELYKRTDNVLYMHVSGKLCKVRPHAKLGAEPLMGRCTIQYLDTNSILLGQGILVKAAARAANDGASLDEIVRIVRGQIPHVYTVLYVETMQHLERSGRIGQAQSILGTMMKIKPLLFMEDGEIIPMEKVKTANKALEKLTEFVAEFDSLEQTIIFQRAFAPSKEANTLVKRLKQIFPDREFPIIQYNPLLASLVGPDALGVVVYEGNFIYT